MSALYKDQFLIAAEDWVCDTYSIDIRYVAIRNNEGIYLLAASVYLYPLPFTDSTSFNFKLETDEILGGQVKISDQKKEDVLKLIKNAAAGLLEINGCIFALMSKRIYGYHSDMIYGDRWFSDLHLQVNGNQDSSIQLSHIDSCKIDNALRQSTPPFDGLSELTTWLGLKNPLQSHEPQSISIHVGPPVDLIFTGSNLNKDVLTLLLHAHPNFDLSRFELAIRAVPGVGIGSRKLVTSEIKWKPARKGKREGLAKIKLKDVDSVFTMLTIGETTVRRQWFLDPIKANNNRLVAAQLFDNNLKQIKNALLESTDPNRFEMGVGALLFLMGFTSAIQIETDAPDIIVTTAGGRIVLVECTTKIADFSKKLGKLVDRKNSLSRVMQDSKSPARVDGMLVCALPKDQIMVRPDELQAHQIILITKDELQLAIERLRVHVDLDKFIDDALAQINRPNFLSG